jgi:beta-xylosidase
LAKDLIEAPNMLTQRTFGPVCSAVTAVDLAGMKDGDTAGLTAFQKHYGFVGVVMEGTERFIVMVSAEAETPVERGRVPLGRGVVRLRVDCDFRNRTDRVCFYYSVDGMGWVRIGSPLQMTYTLPHFMGYRFGLFNFARKVPGGFADFDYYRLEDRILEGI